MSDSRKKKKLSFGWRLLLWIGGGGIVLLLIVAGVISYLLFSPLPSFPVPMLETRDFSVQNRLLGQLMSELWSGRTADSRIVLTPAETESLLRVAANGVLIAGMAKDSDSGDGGNSYEVNYRDGGFDFVVPAYDSKWRWLFGGVVVLRGRVIPHKAGDDFQLEFPHLRLGRLPLPPRLVEKAVRNWIAQRKDDKNFRRFNNTVREIDINSRGEVTIGYRPAELRKSLTGF